MSKIFMILIFALVCITTKSNGVSTNPGSGSILKTGTEDPALILRCPIKGKCNIVLKEALTGDFKVVLKVANIIARTGGIQLRLFDFNSIDRLSEKDFNKKEVVAQIYFAAKKNKPHQFYVTYFGQDNALYSFDFNRKWTKAWRPTGMKWNNGKSYEISIEKKGNKLGFTIASAEKKLKIAPIDLTKMRKKGDEIGLLLGDNMTQYSGGEMTIESISVNGEKINLNIDVPVFKKLSCGLPYSGVFSFGKNEGWLQLPNNYDASKKYPFILFFHGRGGDARLNNFTSADFKNFRKLCAKKGYIVAVPGYGSDNWMNTSGEKITMEMIKFLQQRISIDMKRFYVMGCSMGGASALVFTAKHPNMVKATCDIFGITDFTEFYKKGFYNKSISKAYGGTPAEKPEYYKERSAIHFIDVLKNKPLLIIHGDKDFCVPKWNSDKLVKALKKEGSSVEYVVIHGMGHRNAIIKGREQNIFDFFAAQ